MSDEMTKTLEEANCDLRAAVQARLANSQPDCAIPVDWILQGEAELKAVRESAANTNSYSELWRPQPTTPETLRPGSSEFLRVLDELRELHLKKCMDYGADEDAFSNITSSADVVNVQPWAGCMIRIADKMHRIRSYFRRGRTEFDGVPDTLLDIASYAIIALIKYRQSRQ